MALQHVRVFLESYPNSGRLLGVPVAGTRKITPFTKPANLVQAWYYPFTPDPAVYTTAADPYQLLLTMVVVPNSGSLIAPAAGGVQKAVMTKTDRLHAAWAFRLSDANFQTLIDALETVVNADSNGLVGILLPNHIANIDGEIDLLSEGAAT